MSIEIVFDEIVFDDRLFNLGFAQGSPEYANSNLKSPLTGITNVAVPRFDPQWTLSVNFDDVDHEDAAAGVDYLLNMWYGGQGSAYGFRIRLEWDHKMVGEYIGTGNATLTSFKLTKTYERPGTSGHEYTRRIIKPVVNTNLKSGCPTLYEPDGSTSRVIEVPFKVYFDGTEQTTGWTIDNTTGELEFDDPVPNDVDITVDCQFDFPAQFWTNSFQLQADWPATLKGLTIIEIIPATLGIS